MGRINGWLGTTRGTVMRCNECNTVMIAEEVEWYCPDCGNTLELELDFNDDSNMGQALIDAWEMEHGPNEERYE